MEMKTEIKEFTPEDKWESTRISRTFEDSLQVILDLTEALDVSEEVKKEIDSIKSKHESELSNLIRVYLDSVAWSRVCSLTLSEVSARLVELNNNGVLDKILSKMKDNFREDINKCVLPPTDDNPYPYDQVINGKRAYLVCKDSYEKLKAKYSNMTADFTDLLLKEARLFNNEAMESLCTKQEKGEL